MKGRLTGEQRRLVVENELFARKIARANRRLASEAALEDLESQAMLGLCVAAMRFNAGKGASFRTYAAYWVNRMVLDGIKTEMGAGLHITQRMREAMRAEEKPAWVEEGEAARKAISLDATFSEAFRFADVIPASDASPEEWAVAEETARRISCAVNRLPERERVIARHRWGIEGEAETLSQVAERVGVSRERVRQIERDLPAKIRRELTGRRNGGMMRKGGV